MVRLRRQIGVLVAVLLALTAAGGFWWYQSNRAQADGDQPERVLETLVRQDGFGALSIYRVKSADKGLLLLFSDQDGWTPKFKAMAQQFAQLDYLVVGIDWQRYNVHLQQAQTCVDVAEELLALSQDLLQRYHLDTKSRPIVAGMGTGAALTYAALAQAPERSFHAGISMDFCPQLPAAGELCGGRTLQVLHRPQTLLLQPSPQLRASWYAFQASPACDGKAAEAFIDRIDTAKLVNVGHPIEATPPNPAAPEASDHLQEVSAILQWLDPRLHDQSKADASSSDLPLIEVPAVATSDSPMMAFMMTGDGGWAKLDKTVASELAKQGIPTVALDSLNYFWKARTPDEAGRDLQHILRHYLASWNKQQVLLIGYSFGADALPFMANRLPDDLRARVKLVTMLGLSDQATFEFHLSDWLNAASTATTYAVAPEVAKLSWSKRLCIMGTEEDDSACPSVKASGTQVITMPGDHHFNEDYAGVVRHILQTQATPGG